MGASYRRGRDRSQEPEAEPSVPATDERSSPAPVATAPATADVVETAFGALPRDLVERCQAKLQAIRGPSKPWVSLRPRTA